MRSKTPSFILELKLNTSKADETALDLRFSYGCHIYNVLVRHCRKQINKLEQDKTYCALLSLRRELSGSELKAANKALSNIRKDYGLTEYGLHAFVVMQQRRYKKHIDSNTAQKIATTVWGAVSKHLFGKGECIHFRRNEDFSSVEGKSNNSGIRFKDGRLHWNGLVIQPQIRKGDTYARKALRCRIKYCRISRRIVGTRYHYYLQLILEGIPPRKHETGHGRCGIDIGPSSVAVVSNEACDLFALGDGAKIHKREIATIQRKMDRSRRATNPRNYNPDGTVRKSGKNWVRSNSYQQLARRKADLQRRDAARLRKAHNITANRLLSSADEFYVERMGFSQLAQRSREETSYDEMGHPVKKRRFGRSIGNHAPTQFLSILDRKLRYQGKSLFLVDTTIFRASQYDHVTNTYRKKSLEERTTIVGENLVQRDLYSAYLLKNSLPSLTGTDRNLCVAGFEDFLRLHDTCIQTLLQSTERRPASFGLADFAA